MICNLDAMLDALSDLEEQARNQHTDLNERQWAAYGVDGHVLGWLASYLSHTDAGRQAWQDALDSAAKRSGLTPGGTTDAS